jgi:hypothetical protein
MLVNWAAVEAISNCVVALGVCLAGWQIRESRKNRTMDFEEGIDREYRVITQRFPPEVLLKKPVADVVLQRHLSDFMNYFDLSNYEILFRKSGRISPETWLEWQDGIRQNLEFPAFRAAWTEVKNASKDRFRELRKLEELDFDTDPREW